MTEVTATLKLLGPGETEAEVPVGDRPLMIGRDPGCDIVLDDPAISKKHAQLLLVDGEYMVRDQNSHNGTFVDNERVTHRTLKNGDVIAIGPKKILFSLYGAASIGGELMLAEVDGGPGAGAGLPAEVTPPKDLLGKSLQIMAQEQESRRRFWSVAVSAGIVVAAVTGLIIILNLSGQTYSDGGLVELDLGYGQLVLIPVPEKPYTANVTVDNPSDGKVLTVDARWPDDGQPYDEDLSRIARGYYFVRVETHEEGRARLIVKVRSGKVYQITVIVKRNKTEPGEMLLRLKEAQDTQALEEKRRHLASSYLEQGNSMLSENPADAIDAYNVALEYARHDIALTRTIEEKLELARGKVKERWKALRLSLTKSRSLREKAGMREALLEVKRLVPDPHDARHQWAEILLKRYR
ncbi:MAG: FHA domain-containing protein [Planctomycetota bacterium]